MMRHMRRADAGCSLGARCGYFWNVCIPDHVVYVDVDVDINLVPRPSIAAHGARIRCRQDRERTLYSVRRSRPNR